MDNFLTRVTDTNYRDIIRDAARAHMNMLRVWGGGIYEKDAFYDYCDQYGILVWQDFMFACAMYPGGKDFMKNVQAEAIQQVVRLRNHPSIALWCGNNEISEGWKNWGWAKGYEASLWDIIRLKIRQTDQPAFEKLMTKVNSSSNKENYQNQTMAELMVAIGDSLYGKIKSAIGTNYDTLQRLDQKVLVKYSIFDSMEITSNYKTIFESILKNAVERFDSNAAYISTSPKHGWGRVESTQEGDMHYWGVWHGKEPFSMYGKKVGRFVSEYGFQSFPDLGTINQFTDPPDRKLESDVMKAHQKSPIGYDRMQEYMLQDYNKPKDFIALGYVSQLLQSDAMTIAIEAHRRSMPRCMGTLYWQLDDCWPVVSWSSIDYYGRKKAMFYKLTNEYAEKMLSVANENGRLKVYIVSDSRKSEPMTVTMAMLDFSGNQVWQRDLQINTPVNSSSVIFDTSFSEITTSRKINEILLLVQLHKEGKVYSQQIYYFDKMKNLNLKQPTITKQTAEIPEGYRIDLTTDKLAKNVYLYLPFKGDLSDNYFDLIPGQTRTIIFKTKSRDQNFYNWVKPYSLIDTY